MQTLNELPLEAETVERGYTLNSGLPSSSLYNPSSGSTESYSDSPRNTRSRQSGEHQSTLYSNGHNGGGRSSGAGLYPIIDI